MDHQTAVDQYMVEQYLLNELSPELRDAFEDHYFGCLECAADLRATAAFLEVVRKESTQPVAVAASASTPAPGVPAIGGAKVLPMKSRWGGLGMLGALGALAACLVVMVYQNVAVYPGMKSEIASLEQPQVATTVSLVNANSRGGAGVSATGNPGSSLLLLVDIPAEERYTGYTCLLYSPRHELLWTGKVSPQAAKDTVSIHVPLNERGLPAKSEDGGVYSLTVKGDGGAGTAEELATYQFSLNAAAGPKQ